MATSSIFNTVKITSQKQAEDFVAILEHSEEENCVQKKSSVVDVHPSKEFLRSLLARRMTSK